MSRKSPFPPYPLSDALVIAQTIWNENAGNPTRRIRIFDILGRQPDSSSSRGLITASSGYGLTEGGYKADMLRLTDQGRMIVAEQDYQTKLEAVLKVEVFRAFFEGYRGAGVPNRTTATDFLKEQDIPDERAEDCLDIILKNGYFLGLIREYSGKERIITPEHALEEHNKANGSSVQEEQHDRVKHEETNHKSDTSKKSAKSPTEQLNNIQRVDPALHIDVQIHISADAKPEQIEQIFASMAKHLYNRN